MSGRENTEYLTRMFSYYRDAELRGSNLLYRLLRIVDDPEAQIFLSEHLADETRHAWLWTERIKELGTAPMRVNDGYQVRIGKRVGFPRNLVDLFALTVVVEQRALRRYQDHLKRPNTDERTLEVLKAVIQDEGWHVDWMRKKGREMAVKAGEPDRFDEAIRNYREIDRQVTEDLDALEREYQ